jgi:hypothetical protein
VGKEDKAVAELSGTFVFCIVRLSFFLKSRRRNNVLTKLFLFFYLTSDDFLQQLFSRGKRQPLLLILFPFFVSPVSLLFKILPNERQLVLSWDVATSLSIMVIGKLNAPQGRLKARKFWRKRLAMIRCTLPSSP